MLIINGPHKGSVVELAAGDTQCVMISEYLIDGTGEENERTCVNVVYDVFGAFLRYNRDGTLAANDTTGDTR